MIEGFSQISKNIGRVVGCNLSDYIVVEREVGTVEGFIVSNFPIVSMTGNVVIRLAISIQNLIQCCFTGDKGNRFLAAAEEDAVIRIDRMENMLAGMNASVSIEVETKDNILLIPVDALEEDESGVYVYTSYDEKTETFGDPVQVTTGISDGENVEIVSGLSEGSEFWYSCLDVVNYTTSYSGNGGGFSTESMFGGKSSGRSR